MFDIKFRHNPATIITVEKQ